MKCKSGQIHQWHLVEQMTKLITNIPPRINFFFICDKCGNMKKVERGVLEQ